ASLAPASHTAQNQPGQAERMEIPTGVELAASLAQMVRVTLRNNFRRIDPSKSTIILLDAGKRVLPTFAESVSRKVTRRLEKLGVKVMTDVKVEMVDDKGVIAGGNRITSATVLWTAGVVASPIPKNAWYQN